MAIKEKQEETRSRLMEYLSTEHKWENFLFVFLRFLYTERICLISRGAPSSCMTCSIASIKFVHLELSSISSDSFVDKENWSR